jgi:hypothetical protein
VATPAPLFLEALQRAQAFVREYKFTEQDVIPDVRK